MLDSFAFTGWLAGHSPWTGSIHGAGPVDFDAPFVTFLAAFFVLFDAAAFAGACFAAVGDAGSAGRDTSGAA